MQKVCQREIGKLQTQLTNDTRLSPTGREFHLVVCLRYQWIAYVYGSVFGARLDVRLELFGVEVSHLLNFTQ